MSQRSGSQIHWPELKSFFLGFPVGVYLTRITGYSLWFIWIQYWRDKCREYLLVHCEWAQRYPLGIKPTRITGSKYPVISCCPTAGTFISINDAHSPEHVFCDRNTVNRETNICTMYEILLYLLSNFCLTLSDYIYFFSPIFIRLGLVSVRFCWPSWTNLVRLGLS